MSDRTPTEPDDRRARDLLRKDEIVVRAWPGFRTIRRLFGRAAWRPVGNSARLWTKVGVDDPYAEPPEFAKNDHRAVYASGRFVRLDQADKPQPSPGKGVQKAAKPQNPGAASAGKAAQDDFEHTPSASKTAPTPKKAIAYKAREATAKSTKVFQPKAAPPRGPVPASGKGATEPIDRTPPLPQRPQGAISPAGRYRPQVQTPSRRFTGADEPPPTQVPQKAAPLISKPAEPVVPKPPSTFARAQAPVPPPVARPTPPPAPTPKASPPAPKAAPPIAKAAPTPPPAAPPPKVAPPQPPPATGKAAADLKVGAEFAIPQTQLPAGALNQLGKAQVVPLRRATKAVEEPPPQAAPKATAPVNRAPPLPGGGGGMDDLFGGAAQEGRVRMSRPKKDVKP